MDKGDATGQNCCITERGLSQESCFCPLNFRGGPCDAEGKASSGLTNRHAKMQSLERNAQFKVQLQAEQLRRNGFQLEDQNFWRAPAWA